MSPETGPKQQTSVAEGKHGLSIFDIFQPIPSAIFSILVRGCAPEEGN